MWEVYQPILTVAGDAASALCAHVGGPVTRTAHEIMLPAVSDADCAQFWGIAATLRMCAGHSSSASLGICSVSHAQPLYRLLSVSLCIHNSAPGTRAAR